MNENTKFYLLLRKKSCSEIDKEKNLASYLRLENNFSESIL
jgi:hypothetical protein